MYLVGTTFMEQIKLYYHRDLELSLHYNLATIDIIVIMDLNKLCM